MLNSISLHRPITCQISSAAPNPELAIRELFECCLIDLYVARIGWWKSSYEWWPPVRPPEVGVRHGNADDLSDPFHRAVLERDMLDTRLSQPINDLNSFLGAWNACGDTETFGSPSFFISCHKGDWNVN
jgi:hypothetical protein